MRLEDARIVGAEGLVCPEFSSAIAAKPAIE